MNLTDYCAERGTIKELAEKLATAHSTVSRWVTGTRKVPLLRAREVESATKGAVTCHEMRPDFFTNGKLVPKRQKRKNGK
jgi:DNA-binding transcriptional regulator YdaS (Cro superfamily)